jgi:hypothetical protein
VESEQAVVHHPSDPLQLLVGFGFHHLGPIYEFHHVYVGLALVSWLSWVIYFTVVGSPPYPEFNGCFLTSDNQEIVILWAILVIWDACEYEYAIQCRASSD